MSGWLWWNWRTPSRPSMASATAIALPFEQGPEELADVRLVLNDQH